MYKVDKDLLSMQEARIAVENAREAAKELLEFTQEQLDVAVEEIGKLASKYAKEFAEWSVAETGYGVKHDKEVKNRFVSEYMMGKIQKERYVGVIEENQAEATVDIGVPVGVIAAAVPATSPVSTAIHNCMIAVKAGNPIIIAPHPRAKTTIQKVVELMAGVVEKCSLPENTVQCLRVVSLNGTQELFQHEGTALVLLTGVPKLLPVVKKIAKPFIYGASGNGPVFIERTCQVTQAVKDIIASRTFDNGMVSAAEQSIVVDGPIEKEVISELEKQGAYFLNHVEAKKLAHLLIRQNGEVDAEYVGKSAMELAKIADLEVSKTIKLFIYKQKYVNEANPFLQEMFCPILALYVEPDWKLACEKCLELLMENGKSHTLVIHSKDEKVIREFAIKKPVSRVLVNTPSTFGGLGATTNLFPSMILGSTLYGNIEASDNISPRHLTHVRKVGYGVRNLQQCFSKEAEVKVEQKTEQTLESVLQAIIQAMQ